MSKKKEGLQKKLNEDNMDKLVSLFIFFLGLIFFLIFKLIIGLVICLLGALIFIYKMIYSHCLKDVDLK